ncbi:DUF2235 domain-containing protein [Pseudomonas sp. PD9R]|uniref:DUF2235 domain-containing protein n=1 Tax=Pseudomonas sp. PD9R TaxID=2853534 RepID=UPI001C443C4B|nr:DUF2235 domain-containing protein [Pseudomonas sp. PD9R]MBV6823564.1 DUF2235 domain-containing protein [Pseudomonas sp. PD9R]
MARQLVIFLDGTGNRFSHCPTNIIRLVRSLSDDPKQVLTYYDQGVGTFGLKETLFEWQKIPSRIFGLAFGWGIKRTIEGAYRFIAENLRDDDELYIFGFSRGAYAARALAAVIRAVGVVPSHQAHLFEYGWSILMARNGKENKPDFKLQERFKSTFSRRVNVHFLGLFDTVKSVGWVYDPVSIPFTINNRNVEIVRHAMSVDEKRSFFRQHLWTDDAPRTDVKQVWFPGVHSDVGGGYAANEAQLALGAFRWMLGEAMAVGLHVDLNKARKQMIMISGSVRDACGPMHDSMTDGWKVAEWVPRLIWDWSKSKRVLRIGQMPPFGKPKPRFIALDALLHSSLEERLNGVPAYNPPNLQRPLVRPVVDPLEKSYTVVSDHISVAGLP